MPAEQFNLAKRIDTLLVNPLANLPLGSFGGAGPGDLIGGPRAAVPRTVGPPGLPVASPPLSV
ncbi:hypothetical protein BM536_019880 [Streptomyces phaeoluteigriseus]|uniref:Uncharacterized protein n=1 Tax=Streptomyces phaeoluteigriseus TaxID=114686 RepID=A0A1V6MPS2_9ACTN|nr:hypothetical protein [Streptomyces phaeoluteigriseus]OQD54287.1 hypothetical protein BM536_019880 [Streptomyces phaeoluteigriseus]